MYINNMVISFIITYMNNLTILVSSYDADAIPESQDNYFTDNIYKTMTHEVLTCEYYVTC